MNTFPDRDVILDQFLDAPEYMHPSEAPWLAYEEGILSSDDCLDILKMAFTVEPYQFDHCNAFTREFSRPLDPVFKPISDFLLQANETYWKFDLGEAAAWMQTYFIGNDYQSHMDGTIGQTRKLTAVAMLTDPNNYSGGELEAYIPPNRILLPKTLGTIVVFPHWVIHKVTPILQGTRHTINLGYWGPPFR